MEVSEEVRAMIVQFQAYQQQAQMIAAQKDAIKTQLLEIERTIEEVEKSGDREMFRSVGPILIKSTKDGIRKDLGERKEMTEIRLKTIDAEEKKIREKIRELQEKLQNSLKDSGK